MSGEAAPAAAVEAVERTVRHDGGRLLSLLIALLRDFQLAEDSLQDAVESALIHWHRSGVPRSPSAWLMRTARRKAIDRLRRAANFHAKSAELAELIALDGTTDEAGDDAVIADERLKLIFTCCHPALDQQTCVALTLRSICGLRTEEIARAYLVSPDSMAQRLVRARHKIARAGIPYAVPGPDDWPARLEALRVVIYLIFNAGYAAAPDAYLRVDLCEEAIRLCRILDTLIPHDAEIEGLLSLMLLHRSRFATRVGALGEIVTLEEQDRGQWDRAAIDEGTALLVRALRRGRPGAYQLQAAIAAVHAEAESFGQTDWQEIALIYDALIAVQPNPVFELNRIVALSYADEPEAALARLTALGTVLAGYQPYHAVRADLLARLEQSEAAREAFDAAIRLSVSDAERQYLIKRRDSLAMA